MKKLFIAVMAMAAFAACSNENVLVAPKGNAIAFGSDFIDNATKSIDGTYQNNGAGANELTKFHVYGTVQNANGLANIFNEELVSNTTGAWTYDVNKTQYWVAGNNYSFAAVANAEAVVDVEQGLDGMPTAIKYDATQATDGTQHDLLYAEKKNIAYESGDDTTVKFTFAHLLAKAKFTVKNQMQNGNGNYYTVEDVKILDAVKTATYEVGGTWVEHAGQHDVTFGHVVAEAEQNPSVAAIKLYENGVGASNYERLLIPQEDATLKIQFGLKYYVQDKVNNNSEVLNDSKTKSVDATVTLEAGRAYNFIITLGNPGEPITFDVEAITDWVEEDVETTKVVSSAADLAAAIADPAVGEVVLSSDIDLSSTRAAATIGLVINRDLVIDGQGHKLIHSVSGANARAINVSGAENVTFKNLVIEAAGERAINVIGNSKNVTLEHVTAVAANYTVNVAASAPEANIVISQSHLTGLNTVNIAGVNAVVTINNSTIVCNDQNESEGYYAIAVNKDATNATVTMNGGEIIVKGDSLAGCVGSDNGSIVLNGTETHGATIDDAYFAIEYGNYYYSFNTFEAALAKANEGETIKVIRDVTVESPLKVTKNVTIDLNGKTLTAALKQEGRHHYAIDNYATLTLKGEGAINARGVENFGTMVVDGNLTITNVDTNGGAAIWNEGILTINSGTFTTNATAGEGSYGSALNTQEGATAVINGGTFTAYSQLTYAIINYGATTINDATVKGKHGAVASAEGGYETVINGGTFELMENPGVSDHCAYFVSTIKGGRFTLGNNTDSGAQVFYNSTIATGYKAVEENGWYTVVAE